MTKTILMAISVVVLATGGFVFADQSHEKVHGMKELAQYVFDLEKRVDSLTAELEIDEVGVKTKFIEQEAEIRELMSLNVPDDTKDSRVVEFTAWQSDYNPNVYEYRVLVQNYHRPYPDQNGISIVTVKYIVTDTGEEKYSLRGEPVLHEMGYEEVLGKIAFPPDKADHYLEFGLVGQLQYNNGPIVQIPGT